MSRWFYVVAVGVFGTKRADVAHVGLGIADLVCARAFAFVLVATFTTGHRSEGT